MDSETRRCLEELRITLEGVERTRSGIPIYDSIEAGEKAGYDLAYFGDPMLLSDAEKRIQRLRDPKRGALAISYQRGQVGVRYVVLEKPGPVYPFQIQFASGPPIDIDEHASEFNLRYQFGSMKIAKLAAEHGRDEWLVADSLKTLNLAAKKEYQEVEDEYGPEENYYASDSARDVFGGEKEGPRPIRHVGDDLLVFLKFEPKAGILYYEW